MHMDQFHSLRGGGNVLEDFDNFEGDFRRLGGVGGRIVVSSHRVQGFSIL